MTSRYLKLVLILSAFCIVAGEVAAQEPEPPVQTQSPKPAGRGVPSLDPNVQDQNAQQDWKPDTSPATGLQAPTIGNPELRHSYFVPGFQYTGSGQNQQLSASSPGGWYSTHFLGANLSFLQQWSRSQLAINYSGGGFFTSSPGQDNGSYHQLAFAQSFAWRRWQLQILDQFSYLPESQFGFGGGTGLSVPGISGSLSPSTPPIVPAVTPNQTNFGAIGPQYNNSVVSQITYQTSPRGSITVGGSYGISRFTDAGNIESNTYVGNAGYNYALTKADTIGVFYRFSSYHFLSGFPAVGDQLASFVYERKVTRRLALQLEGGPDITDRKNLLGVQVRSVSGSGGANLRYAFQNGSLSGSYSHGVSSGGGLLSGSTTDQVNASANKSIGRAWSVQANAGFARNRTLPDSGAAQSLGFNSIFAGGGISRPIGRNVDFSLAYQARIQQTSTSACTGASCSSSYTQSSIFLNLQWHSRPFVLR